MEKINYPLVRQYEITSKFGPRPHPITGQIHFHNGIDIATPEGTEVIAPAGGVVVDVGEDDRSGIYLKANLIGGLIVSFAHLSEAVLSRGDHFKAGDVLALTGNTGATTGPHLHYRVRDSYGNDIDPLSVTNGDDHHGAIIAAAAALGVLLWQ